jgi:hypothetical protein
VSHVFLLLLPEFSTTNHDEARGRVLMIGSDKPATPAVTEQVSEQVVSVCMALGVSREHAELVMRVMAACTNQADAGAGQGV